METDLSLIAYYNSQAKNPILKLHDLQGLTIIKAIPLLAWAESESLLDFTTSQAGSEAGLIQLETPPKPAEITFSEYGPHRDYELPQFAIRTQPGGKQIFYIRHHGTTHVPDLLTEDEPGFQPEPDPPPRWQPWRPFDPWHQTET